MGGGGGGGGHCFFLISCFHPLIALHNLFTFDSIFDGKKRITEDGRHLTRDAEEQKYHLTDSGDRKEI